jgi:hypothetical protein
MPHQHEAVWRRLQKNPDVFFAEEETLDQGAEEYGDNNINAANECEQGELKGAERDALGRLTLSLACGLVPRSEVASEAPSVTAGGALLFRNARQSARIGSGSVVVRKPVQWAF